MLTAQITDVDYYNQLVKDEQVGFSIEGFLGMKLSKHLKQNNMNFPDGEHTIDGKIYLVKDGEVTEIRDQFNELLYEVRQDRGNNIDFSKNFTNITQ